MKPRDRAILDWVLPIAALAVLTVPFWVTDLDANIARGFYTPGEGWSEGRDAPWQQLYRYGVIPAWIVAVSALAVFVASFWAARVRRHRRAALFLVLAMVIGPGLLTNSVFKQNWGRPRPLDLVQFGSDSEYVMPLVKSARENGGSFASGHAATAFYLLVPYFIVRRRSKSRAAFFLVLGLGFGALVGLARMIQGAHFLSDVVWALGLVYLGGLAAFYALRLDRDEVAAAAVVRTRDAAP